MNNPASPARRPRVRACDVDPSFLPVVSCPCGGRAVADWHLPLVPRHDGTTDFPCGGTHGLCGSCGADVVNDLTATMAGHIKRMRVEVERGHVNRTIIRARTMFRIYRNSPRVV